MEQGESVYRPQQEMAAIRRAIALLLAKLAKVVDKLDKSIEDKE